MGEQRLQLGLGPLVAAIGAVILLVSLFIDWFEPGLSAWTAFESIDLILAALGLTVLAVVFTRALPVHGTWRPRSPLWLLGAAALVLVVSQLLNPPPAAQESDPDIGAWLALAAALLICIGGLLALVNVTVAVRPDAVGAHGMTGHAGPAPPEPAGPRRHQPPSAPVSAPGPAARPPDPPEAGEPGRER